MNLFKRNRAPTLASMGPALQAAQNARQRTQRQWPRLRVPLPDAEDRETAGRILIVAILFVFGASTIAFAIGLAVRVFGIVAG